MPVFPSARTTRHSAVSFLVDGNGSSDDRVGLFDFVAGSIKRLSLSNAHVTGTGTLVGGIVGGMYDGTTDCDIDSQRTVTSTSTVPGTPLVGGLMGQSDWALNSYSAAVVTGSSSTVASGIGVADSLANTFASGTVSGGPGSGQISSYPHACVANPYIDNSFYLDTMTCGGCCATPPLEGSAEAATFFAGSNPGALYSTWDFVNVWMANASEPPTLR